MTDSDFTESALEHTVLTVGVEPSHHGQLMGVGAVRRKNFVGGLGVKRERPASTEAPPLSVVSSSSDVYKTLSLRVGGHELLPLDSAALPFADVVPCMWKEKPLNTTLKSIMETAATSLSEPLLRSLNAQLEQLNRRFVVLWNDYLFNGLTPNQTSAKVSLDPQAWLISETAMEVILQVAYPMLSQLNVQKTLKKYKSLTPHDQLLNPETSRREWDKVAYLIKDRLDSSRRDYLRYVQFHQKNEETQKKYEESNKAYQELLTESNAEKLTIFHLRARMDTHRVEHDDIQ